VTGRARRGVAVAAALAGLFGADVAVTGPAARALDPPRAIADGVPGPAGAVVRVDRVRRREGALQVTLTLAVRGDGGLTPGLLRSYRRPEGTFGVAALDPATGRRGELREGARNCPCSRLFLVHPGEAATFVAVLDDPGGATVDVVFDTFQPVTGVPVEGDGAPSPGATSTLAARALTPLPRRRDAGAGVTGTDRVDLDTDVLFAFGSATLSPKAARSIAVAVRVLGAQPRRRLSVTGHTDGIGTPAANLDLSRRRAQAVRAALATALGPGWTFEVQGLGETRPVAAERTPEGADDPAGRARNRRVELRLVG